MPKSRDHLKQLVARQYSDAATIEANTKIGLFNAEETLIDRFVQGGNSILDIGCGAGRTTIHLAQKGFNAHGIDMVPGMIDAARRQAAQHDVNVTFDVLDATAMDFADCSFDNVFLLNNAFNQIPGCQYRERLIGQIFSIVKPGGCFILSSRSGMAWGKRWLVWACTPLMVLYQRYRRGIDWEVGDKVWNRRYHHYENPFRLRSLLVSAGFEWLYFNSGGRIDRGKESNLFTNFSRDRHLYYVCRRPPLAT